MKKIITLISILLTITAMLIGCEVNSTQTEEITESEYKELEITDIKYNKKTKNLSFLINNYSKSNIYYGYAYSIEVKENNKWIKTNLTDELVFIEIALIVEPNKSRDGNIDLSQIKPLKNGKYRIVRDYNNDEANITQYIEFTVRDLDLTNFSAYNVIKK